MDADLHGIDEVKKAIQLLEKRDEPLKTRVYAEQEVGGAFQDAGDQLPPSWAMFELEDAILATLFAEGRRRAARAER